MLACQAVRSKYLWNLVCIQNLVGYGETIVENIFFALRPSLVINSSTYISNYTFPGQIKNMRYSWSLPCANIAKENTMPVLSFHIRKDVSLENFEWSFRRLVISNEQQVCRSFPTSFTICGMFWEFKGFLLFPRVGQSAAVSTKQRAERSYAVAI